MKDIVFENVTKSYGDNVVIDDLSLRINDGERLVLLGPSGCGKSTILRMIAGLESISSGDLYMGKERVNEVTPGDRNVSMVFQNYALFPHMTVSENIIYALKSKKISKDEIDRAMKTSIKMLELEGLENRKPKDLSGGQRQRVALARAIVKRSNYFLLDEPLSNLDAQLRGTARKMLVKLHDTYKQTFIYVTHDQVEAMTVGERIALMNKGKLQMLDTPNNIYNRPSNVFTAKFIGSPSTNIIKISYDGLSLVLKKQKISLEEKWRKHINKSGIKDILLGIRPEHISLEKEYHPNSIKGTVKYIEDYGNGFGIYFEVEGNEVISTMKENLFLVGDTVFWRLDQGNMYIFDEETENSIGYPEE